MSSMKLAKEFAKALGGLLFVVFLMWMIGAAGLGIAEILK